jgi:hypothetical protein
MPFQSWRLPFLPNMMFGAPYVFLTWSGILKIDIFVVTGLFGLIFDFHNVFPKGY